MKIIIVEDELPAARQLESLLEKADPSIEIQGIFQTAQETVQWLQSHPEPDLGFFDIRLSDNTSFAIFEQCSISFPVVFVTAYNDYLLKAFEYNSVHYLLKPVNLDKIRQVLQKIEKIEKHFLTSGIRNILTGYSQKGNYKTRLIVKKGIDYVPLETSDIAYIFSRHKITFVRDKGKNTFMLDRTLGEIEAELDPSLFFRANRQFIIHIVAIQKFKSVESGKIRLVLVPETQEDVEVSKENAVVFRQWIGKN